MIRRLILSGFVVVVVNFLEYPENAKNPPDKTYNRLQKQKSSGNLPVSV